MQKDMTRESKCVTPKKQNIKKKKTAVKEMRDKNNTYRKQ